MSTIIDDKVDGVVIADGQRIRYIEAVFYMRGHHHDWTSLRAREE